MDDERGAKTGIDWVKDLFSILSIASAAVLFCVIYCVWGNDVREALLDATEPDSSKTLDEALLPASSSPPPATLDAKARQNAVYKRWGGALILFGLGGGFAPSITKAIIHNHVWDVGTDRPHPDVDTWLYVHIAGGLLWGVAIVSQLISGGSSVAWKQAWHRIMGWLGVVSVLGGVAFAGGLVWTIHYDFCVPESFSLAAGLYTIVLAIASSVNMILAVVYAKKREFATHKDYALCAIYWTMDDGSRRPPHVHVDSPCRMLLVLLSRVVRR